MGNGGDEYGSHSISERSRHHKNRSKSHDIKDNRDFWISDVPTHSKNASDETFASQWKS